MAYLYLEQQVISFLFRKKYYKIEWKKMYVNQIWNDIDEYVIHVYFLNGLIWFLVWHDGVVMRRF